MKTFIFIRNKKYRPSTYYRISQYLEGVSNKSFELIEYETNEFYNKKAQSKFKRIVNTLWYSLIPGYINRLSNIFKILKRDQEYSVFIQRECFPKVVGPIGRILFKKMIHNASNIYWDFDDNIFESKEITKFEKELLFEYSDVIFVGNQYLWGKVESSNKKKVTIINTTDTMMECINLNDINRKRESLYHNELSLVWVGTKGNLKYLEHIISDLDKSASKLKGKKLVLKVICDGELETQTKFLIVKNIKWERQVAFDEMLSAHIGLMPLIETEFTKGKCAFKAVQAIGCGLPVIVSDVGMNKEVVANQNGVLIDNNRGWSEAVIDLSKDIDMWTKKSILSRELWLKEYNSRKNRDLLLSKVLKREDAQ
ncbi:glycosyltransferase [Bacillus wiedmannii]|uniref:glycosyltransferase n=1 Tax=Bacillus wiedmannii TaxID=1890302 RepID=UPI0015D4CBFC|nr:glycosyltransferase [Bacillus wiedmannii]